jgi:hypothetical protein
MIDRTKAMDNLIAQDADLIEICPDDLAQRLFIEADNFKVDREVGMRAMLYRAADCIEAQSAEIKWLRVEAKAQYDRGYYDGCTRSVMQSDDCPKCDKFGDDCGEHSPSWEELAAYWKAEAERLRSIQEQSK